MEKEELKDPHVIGALIQAHLRAASGYALLVIRALFGLNAAVGFAAFAKMPCARLPLILCACGAICAICAAALSWFAQNRYLDADSNGLLTMLADREEEKKYHRNIERKQRKRGGNMTFFAGAFCVLSGLCFVAAICRYPF